MTRKLQLDQLLLSNSTALSCIVVQHADDGYSRRGNFGRILFTVSCVFIVFARWHQRLWFKRSDVSVDGPCRRMMYRLL